MTQLLSQGWGVEKVTQRHVRYVAPLLEQGMRWETIKGADRPVVEHLVRTHILGIPGELDDGGRGQDQPTGR